MDSPKSFKIGVRRKIPYLTNLILLLVGLFFLVLLFFDFVFYPIKDAPLEMQAAVFYWLVPEFWKKVITISAFGFIATSFLFAFLRFYKPAVLRFDTNDIQIRGKAFRWTMHIRTINKINCNDAMTSRGELKERFSVQFVLKRHKAITIKLKNYSDMDDFLEQLIKYENLDIRYYDALHLLSHTDEE